MPKKKEKDDILVCLVCNQEKSSEMFYDYFQTRCKTCVREQANKKYRDENGTVEKVLPTPNTYVSDAQRADTFEFMKAIGYNFNEENGVWLKPGVKELIDGQIVFNNVDSSIRPHRRQKYFWTLELCEEIYNLSKSGYTYAKIGKKFGIHKAAIYRMLSKYDKIRKN